MTPKSETFTGNTFLKLRDLWVSFDHRLDLNEWTVGVLAPVSNSWPRTLRKQCSVLSVLAQYSAKSDKIKVKKYSNIYNTLYLSSHAFKISICERWWMRYISTLSNTHPFNSISKFSLKDKSFIKWSLCIYSVSQSCYSRHFSSIWFQLVVIYAL